MMQIQTVEKSAEPSHIQTVGRIAEVPTVTRVSKYGDVAAIETIEKVMEVPVIKKVEVPQAVGKIGGILRIQTVRRPSGRSSRCHQGSLVCGVDGHRDH